MAAQLHYASLITRQDPNARVYLRVGHASAGEAGYGPAGPPQDLHVTGMIGTALGRAAEFPQAAAMLKSGHRDREEQPDLFRTRQVLIAKQLELGPEHVPGQRAATGYIFLIASRRINNRTQVHVGGNYVRQADERGRWPPRDKSTGAFLCAARCQKKPVKAPSCPGQD